MRLFDGHAFVPLRERYADLILLVVVFNVNLDLWTPLPTHPQRTSTRPSRHADQSVAYSLDTFVKILPWTSHLKRKIWGVVADFPIEEKV
jgi:hypothetical protein